jgi:hypothetical protein
MVCLALENVHSLGSQLDYHPSTPSCLSRNMWFVQRNSSTRAQILKRYLGSSLTYSLICLKNGLLNFDNLITINVVQTALSIVFNALATGLVAGRLLWHRRSLRRAGVVPAVPTRIYTDLTSIFIESAGLYTICGVVYLPFVKADSPLVDPFALLVRMLSFLGPAMIQLRIAEGTAYGDWRGRSEENHSGAEAHEPSTSDIEFSTRPRTMDDSNVTVLEPEIWVAKDR